MKIDPRALSFEKDSHNAVKKQPQRSPQLTLVTFIRNSLTAALEKVFDTKTITVRMENEKAVSLSLQQLLSAVTELGKNQKGIQIGKGSLTSQKVDTATIANIEELRLENIEKLSFAFEQLKPIITSLQAGNKLDQQSVAQLKNMTSALLAMHNSLRSIEKKEVSFPVEEIVTAVRNVEEKLGTLKFEVPEREAITFPAFPKSMSMTEGKAMLTLLQSLADKIDSLPKSFPEVTIPKTVTVANFPPQKYPMPVTNININPLHGYPKSTALTVSTTAKGLPTTALAYRRTMIIYNNDSTNTLYIGGSDVTTANGTPITPLSFSPAIDAGPKMIVYGIAASPLDIRVFEVSNERGAYDT